MTPVLSPTTLEIRFASLATRLFNESDASYFFPLMEQVEQCLGCQPRFGTWDAAHDAHYVHGYFAEAGGFEAVPMVGGRRGSVRHFSPEARPLCAASLAMPRLFTYQDRTALVPHEREKCGCPLLVPEATGEGCPITDPHFAKGGCTTTLASSSGARLRHTLARQRAAAEEVRPRQG